MSSVIDLSDDADEGMELLSLPRKPFLCRAGMQGSWEDSKGAARGDARTSLAGEGTKVSPYFHTPASYTALTPLTDSTNRIRKMSSPGSFHSKVAYVAKQVGSSRVAGTGLDIKQEEQGLEIPQDREPAEQAEPLRKTSPLRKMSRVKKHEGTSSASPPPSKAFGATVAVYSRSGGAGTWRSLSDTTSCSEGNGAFDAVRGSAPAEYCSAVTSPSSKKRHSKLTEATPGGRVAPARRQRQMVILSDLEDEIVDPAGSEQEPGSTTTVLPDPATEKKRHKAKTSNTPASGPGPLPGADPSDHGPTGTTISASRKRKPRRSKAVASKEEHAEHVANRGAVEAVLGKLRLKLGGNGQIVHVEKRPATEARYADANACQFAPKVRKALAELGIRDLYSHQAEAVSAVFNGDNVVAATPTASGKSMAYIIPILDAIAKVPKARALLLFPLKALAHDQLKAIQALVEKVKPSVKCYSYDGDTPVEMRPTIRRSAQIIVTNPDMLHQAILPYHRGWEAFFRNLVFVVVDEAHYYRGLLGSHMGCILRRLIRVAHHYDQEPQFICCSATIANPQEHVSRLIGGEVQTVAGSGAPLGAKYVVCWQPPVLDEGKRQNQAVNDGRRRGRPAVDEEKRQSQAGGEDPRRTPGGDEVKRRSPYIEAAEITAELVKEGLQTLVFVGARKLAEIVCNHTRNLLDKERRTDLVDKVESYRAGYLAEDRRTLEKRLSDGDLCALVTTSALELGIDVGALDVTVHVGMPDTMCSFWQQAGRAGRRSSTSMAILIAQDRPLDQHFMLHPEELFARPVENALCNPFNDHLLHMHLPCAASELPLMNKDAKLFGPGFDKVRDDLAGVADLVYQLGPHGEDQYRYRWADSPAVQVSIRGISNEQYEVVDGQGKVVEKVEKAMVYRRVHPGAILLHQRASYEVVTLDLENKRAIVTPTNGEDVTEPKERIQLHILEILDSRPAKATTVHYGKVRVVESVVSFTRKHIVTDRVMYERQLHLPPTEFETCAVWWGVPPEAWYHLSSKGMLSDGLTAVKQVTTALLPKHTMSDRTDINGYVEPLQTETGGPFMFIYDACPGGIGISQQAFQSIEVLWQDALTRIQECECRAGCPSCVQPSESGEDSMKKAGKLLLEGLLGTWMDLHPHPAAGLIASPSKEQGGCA